MDFNRHLPRWLTTARVEFLGGQYEGVIDAVTEEPIRNKHTGETRPEPVVTFRDGERMIPNIGQRRALCESLGTNTDRWIGVRLRIFLRIDEHVDRATGECKRRSERAVMIVGDPVRIHATSGKIVDTELTADDIFLTENVHD